MTRFVLQLYARPKKRAKKAKPESVLGDTSGRLTNLRFPACMHCGSIEFIATSHNISMDSGGPMEITVNAECKCGAEIEFVGSSDGAHTDSTNMSIREIRLPTRVDLGSYVRGAFGERGGFF